MANNDIIPGFDNEVNEQLNLILAKEDGAIIIQPIGTIDTYNSGFFQNQFSKIVNADFLNIIFDMSSLTYISSTGIGSFAAFLRQVNSKGGSIIIIEFQQKIKEVFDLLGFTQFFTIKENLNEALEHLKQNAESSNNFPAVVQCPACGNKLKAVRAGKFRCSKCKAIMTVDNNANTKSI